MVSNLARFLSAPFEQKLYVIAAVAYLGRARLEFGLRNVGRIVADLQWISTPKTSRSPDHRLNLETLSWAVEAAARCVPWRADCLIQAIATARWLNKHGYPAVFYLGVQENADGRIAGHAWVSVNGGVVTGRPVEGYATLLGPPPADTDVKSG